MTPLQTAIEAMEAIARRNEVAPIEARIAREAIATLRSMTHKPDCTSLTKAHYLGGPSIPFPCSCGLQLPTPVPVPSVDLDTVDDVVNDWSVLMDIGEEEAEVLKENLHALLTSRLKGATHD